MQVSTNAYFWNPTFPTAVVNQTDDFFRWSSSELPISKRIFDLLAASLILVLTAPLWVTVIVLLYLQGGSPLFFHTRVGAGGKNFKCIKFRSMAVNSSEILKQHLSMDLDARSEWQKTFKLKNDPRVTKLGKFIRKTSIDEIPQLLNVLKGEMTLVGPRPVVDEEIRNYYKAYAPKCFMQAPGVTGLWQITGRNDVEYSTRIALDLLYLKKSNFWFDIKIIVLTGLSVVLRKGQ